MTKIEVNSAEFALVIPPHISTIDNPTARKIFNLYWPAYITNNGKLDYYEMNLLRCAAALLRFGFEDALFITSWGSSQSWETSPGYSVSVTLKTNGTEEVYPTSWPDIVVEEK